MKRLAFSFSLLVLFSVSQSAFASDPVMGSGSYKIDKDHLDRVKPYKAPLNIHIVDERPIISNHMQAEEKPDSYEIYAGIPPAREGRHFIIGAPVSGGATPAYRSSNPNLNSGGLAPASDMFHSNMPKRLPASAANLPPGQSTGIHGPTGQNALPAQPSASLALSGRMAKPATSQPTAKSYDIDISKASDSGFSVVKTRVSGTIKASPLVSRLKSN